MKQLIAFITLFVLFVNCTNSQQNKQEVMPTSMELSMIDTTWTKKVKKTNTEWEKELTSNEYNILREKGTERPFSSTYNSNKKEGVYLCVACKNPLFSSSSKFNSGTGWPSFFTPFFSKSVAVGKDNSHGMTRDEVVCDRCEGHLGHVFNDGPAPTGLRYCINGVSLQFAPKQSLSSVVFAQGCFWCVEEVFESIKGVKTVVSGYSGGDDPMPTYKKVGSGQTKHAEAVEVVYDENVISYQDLLTVYFNSGDITQVNGQGNDIGAQYRSIVFYKTPQEKLMVENYVNKLNESGEYSEPIAVEIKPFKKFYEAEAYHQDYVKLHPNQSYVVAVSIPRYKKAIKNFPELLK